VPLIARTSLLAAIAGLALVAPLAPPCVAQTQDPVAVVPPELSEDARKAYNQGLKEARDLMTRKEFAAATARIDALLASRPREPQARFLKGVAQTEQGQSAAAIATFRGLVEDYPELPEPYNNLAVLYAQKGDYENARVVLETAIRAAPDWAVAHENLGDVYARLAAAQYNRAATLDKGNKTAPAKLVLARQLLAPK
jgi:Flp pilus assembly protein TadD